MQWSAAGQLGNGRHYPFKLGQERGPGAEQRGEFVHFARTRRPGRDLRRRIVPPRDLAHRAGENVGQRRAVGILVVANLDRWFFLEGGHYWPRLAALAKRTASSAAARSARALLMVS